MCRTRGFFGIGIVAPKDEKNVGLLWRGAHCFGADYIFTVGYRYSRVVTDTTDAGKHTVLFDYANVEDLLKHLPRRAELVGIEIMEEALPLPAFAHPEQAVYVLGPEDGSLPEAIIEACACVVQIPTQFCLNVAQAGTVVMYDRWAKAMTKNRAPGAGEEGGR